MPSYADLEKQYRKTVGELNDLKLRVAAVLEAPERAEELLKDVDLTGIDSNRYAIKEPTPVMNPTSSLKEELKEEGQSEKSEDDFDDED